MYKILIGQSNDSLPHGVSLIGNIVSDYRNCSSASIPEIYCSCYEETPIFDSSVIKASETVPKIVDKINEMTEKFRSKCTKFVFRAINAIYKRMNHLKTEKDDLGKSQSFIVQLYVSPGMALFETVIKRTDKKSGFEILGEITRINRYGNQSHCITDKRLKSFCFCNDLF